MGLLSKAESSGQNQNAGGIDFSELPAATPYEKKADGLSLDFSAGGAEIFSLSTTPAISAKLKNRFEKGGDEFSRALAALYDRLLTALDVAFARPNAALRGENGEIKLIMFTSQNFDEKLLQTHIRRTFAPLLGDAANLLVVTKAGRAASVEEAQKILEG